MAEMKTSLLSESAIELEVTGGAEVLADGHDVEPVAEPVIVEPVVVERPEALPIPDLVVTTKSKNDATKPKRRGAGQYIKNHITMKVKDNNDAIERIPTTYFGDVEFRGAVRRSMSKFVRLSNDTKPKKIYDLMLKHWKMEQPRLLISVTGGAKSFALDPILKQNFTVGLSKLAVTPGCWVITGGTNAGVMKHVGDALQGSNALIGIATWGIVSERESLKPDDNDVESSCQYKVSSWLTESGAFLDSNHSHFLLVDDGTEGKYGREIKFRGLLEKYIVTKGKFAEGKNVNIPSVLLVLEGGPGTVGTIYEAVAGDNPLPVVIIKSSGRAADVFVYALTCAEIIAEEGKENQHPGLLEQVRTLLPETATADDVNKCYDQIIKCLKYKDSFTISQVGSGIDVDDAILEALLKEGDTSTYRQLELSLAWNRVDLAREKVFRGMVKWEGKKEELEWITIMALAMNNVEFVKLLLDYGVSISSILTSEVLEFLYGYRSYDKTSPLRCMIGKTDHDPIVRKSVNAHIYEKLISYHDDISSENVTLSRCNIERLIRRLCKSLCKTGDEVFIEKLRGATTLFQKMKREAKRETKIAFLYPFRELFFWAVLNNMQDMALLFWKLGEEHMAKSLIAAYICDKLTEETANQQDIVKSLTETATKFREGSLDLLDKCYKVDDRQTTTLITNSFNQFKGLNIINLALASENLDFVSHYAVQQVIEAKWIGKLKDKDVNFWQVFFAWVFPPLILTFNFLTKDELKEMDETEEEDEEVEEDEEEEVEEEEEEDNGLTDKDDDNNGNDNGDDNGADNGDVKDDNVFNDVRDGNSIVVNYPGQKYVKKNVPVEEEQQLSVCVKFREFYNTPVVKFVSHTIAYLVFIVLLSYSSMTDTQDTKLKVIDWVLVVTVFGYLVNEIYQIIKEETTSVKTSLTEWASSMLNMFDAFVITLYFIALALRVMKRTMYVGQLLYNFNAGLWWLRLLHILLINPTLGPYLVMISKMVQDLIKFMYILFIIIIAYGVTSSSILTPHPEHMSDINRIRNVVWKPYFNVYGELFADGEPEGNSTRFGTPYHNSYDETIAWILLGIYMLFTNILLLNLLIAVFNDRYTEVKEIKLKIWKFKRFGLISEYGARHALFPPFSLIGHAFEIIRWIIGKIKPHKTVLRSDISKEKKEDLLEFECDCMTQMTKSNEKSITKTVEEMASDLLEEMDKVNTRMVVIEERLNIQTSADTIITNK